jgi:hypothetical protein
MGWTKDPSAILTLRHRLKEVRAELRSLVGMLSGPKARVRAVRLLREHEALGSALAYGHRDGTLKAEIGVATGYKPKDLSHLVLELLEEGPDTFTFEEGS